MYEITDVTRDYLFVRLRLRNVQTGETRDWDYWEDMEEWLSEEYGVKNLMVTEKRQKISSTST